MPDVFALVSTGLTRRRGVFVLRMAARLGARGQRIDLRGGMAGLSGHGPRQSQGIHQR
jgi:hypothetical protein